MLMPPSLPAGSLNRRLDPATLPFETTEALPDLAGLLGQERALEAIRFGIAMRHDGYNLFVLGSAGTGRHEVTRRYLEEHAASEPVPDDHVYVHGFTNPEQPVALSLPAGRGAELRRDMDRLIEDLRVVLPAAFDSNDYRTRRSAMEDELKERQNAAVEAVRARAAAEGIALIRTPTGVALAPLKGDEVMPPPEFEALSAEQREAIEQKVSALHDELEAAFRELPRWEKEHRERVRKLDQEVTRYAVDHLHQDNRARYQDLPAVVAHLDAVARDVVEHVDRFLPPMPGVGAPIGLPRLFEGADEPDPFRRYRVNLLVDRTGCRGAPVVYEDQPTVQALVGRVDNLARFGALSTDFTLIRAGALHRANGGYLVLDARKLLAQPMAWDTLKRALQANEIRIESLGQALSLVSTVSLEPLPIPIQLKVVLIGEASLYYLLAALDPDFNRLFKVPAEFEDRMPRTPESTLLFARLLATVARRSGLRPLDRGAVACMVGLATRMAHDVDKLSTAVVSLGDLLREADFHRAAADRAAITEADINAAIAADERRRGSYRDRVLEGISQGTIRVETTGVAVGQVNGLAVMELGGLAFGRPSRITARVWPGRGRVLDIEREVQLGGPLHSKGVLILSGFLGGRFGPRVPLALSASLVFEQSYGGVDGDSATLAETVAMLSAIADVPLRQDVAITGSLDQRGLVQAVGGVNEKIEGFFAVCALRGLTGTQGVIIPADNVRHLQLRDEVTEAVAAGRFHVWTASNVDQALTLLSGLDAGALGPDGAWTPGSVNARVEASLAHMATHLRQDEDTDTRKEAR